VGTGPPATIATLPNSYTGHYLAAVLNGDGASSSNGRK
jgi:hypothetical protein